MMKDDTVTASNFAVGNVRLDRRGFLRVGAVTAGALGSGPGSASLADVIQSRAAHAATTRATPKSVIMIVLPGGPSHIDMYDPKPGAPAEFRGEFQPISTVLPGVEFTEHLPLQAQIADKISVIRSLKFQGRHDPYELLSGYPSQQTGQIRTAEKWPVFGSVVSRLHSDRTTGMDRSNGMPAYVNLNDLRVVQETDDPEVPRYMGHQHGPFRPTGEGLQNLKRPDGITAGRLSERRALLAQFDQVRRAAEGSDEMRALDEYHAQAFDMVSSGAVYQALDLSRENTGDRARYQGFENLLLARRLVEAGVSVVTVAQGGFQRGPGLPVFGTWDTHAENFPHMRKVLPEYDRAIYTLLTDLYERGLDQHVAVVIWGEFGRTPRIGDEARALGSRYATGRGHWWDAGFAIVAGGGLRMGQVIGETDARAEQVKSRVYTPQNVLATIYRLLGIDPGRSFLDFQGRPIHLLDQRDPISELL